MPGLNGACNLLTAPLIEESWESYHAFLTSRNGGACVEAKLIGDGIYAAIKPLLFHWTMIVGLVGDRWGIEDRWCYEDRHAAEKGLRAWDGTGDPTGWHRHPRSCRRRPGGDPRREYLAP